jgi:hypothetical protein
MMQQMTLSFISKYHKQLDRLSEMKEEDVRALWIQPGDDPDISNLQYNWSIPLYQKMIFRFRQCEQSPFRFCNQIDPVNQSRMMSYYQIYDDFNRQLIDFFAWLKNGLGVYDLYELDGSLDSIEEIEKSIIYQLWKVNEIKFFFGISHSMQMSLINRYNKDCIDKYNQCIRGNKITNSEI